MHSSRSRSHRGSGTASNQLLHGDCIALMRTLKSDSVDLVCTDPPYGIGFMGHAWDSFTPAYQREVLARDRAARRPLRYQGSSYAGSYDHSPKAQGAFQEFIRATSAECLRVLKPGCFMFVTMTPHQDSLARVITGMEEAGFDVGFTSLYWTFSSGFPKAAHIGRTVRKRRGVRDVKPALKGAYGGFQPKPAIEVVIVAMKPLSEKSYLDQALASGKGVTWLDDARIPGEMERFPANLLVSDDALGDYSRFFSLDAWKGETLPFLIVPKASKREKDHGLEGVVPRQFHNRGFSTSSVIEKPPGYGRKNHHPTVKPLALMAYLITLGSRPGDLVLDPFLGSGTTALAAKLLGRRYLGIEREREYLAIARARLAAVSGVGGRANGS